MRVLLADGTTAFVDGLRSVLTKVGVEVVGIARTAPEAVEHARALRPDVLLVDLAVPCAEALDALRAVSAELPETRIVALTASDRDDDVFEAVRAGACVGVSRTQPTQTLLAALVDAARGEVVLSPGLAARVLDAFAALSRGHARCCGGERGNPLWPREAQILSLIAGGVALDRIGRALFLSERTLKSQLAEIVRRLHLESRSVCLDDPRRAEQVT